MRPRTAIALSLGALLVALAAWGLWGASERREESQQSGGRGAPGPAESRAGGAARAERGAARSSVGEAPAGLPFQEPTTAAAMGFVVRGVLANKKGEPIAGAEVRIERRSDGETIARARSDATGAFIVGFDRGAQALAAAARGAGYAPRRIPTIEPPIGGALDLGLLILSRPSSLAGRVVDGSGRGVARARVLVHQLSTGRDANDPAIAGDDGAFEATGLGEGFVEAAAAAEGFADAHLPYLALLEGERREVEIPLHQETPFVGTVVDDDGRPIEGAAVLDYIMALEGPFWRSPARTDAEGRFALRGISLNQIPIRIFKLGFEQRLASYSDAFPSGERFALARAPVGRVAIESADGAPVPRVRGFHWYPELSQGRVMLRAAVESWHWEAQPDGRLLVTLDPRMRELPSRLALLFDDGSIALSEPIAIPKDRPMPTKEAPLDFTVRRDRRTGIAGRVLDARGAPVAGARVSAGFDGDQIRDEAAEAASAVSDTRGRYAILGLTTARYLVFGPGPRSGERGVPAATELGKVREGIDVIAEEGCEVSGVVTVGGRPAAFASVAAYADTSMDYFARRLARTVADAKGNYRIVGLTPGRAVLFASSFEESAGPAGRSEEPGQRLASELAKAKDVVTLAPGAPARRDIALVESAWGRIVGTILVNGRARGQVLVEADLRLTPMIESSPLEGSPPSGANSEWIKTSSDSSGHYQLLLERPGEYEIVARASGLVGTARVTLASRATVEANIAIATGEIEGSVVDETGRPIEAEVDLVCERQGHAEVRSTRSDGPIVTNPADGSFRFTDVQEGRYRVVARAAKAGFATALGDAFEVAPRGFVALKPIVLARGAALELTLDVVGGAFPWGNLHMRAVDGSPPLLRTPTISIRSEGIVIAGLPKSKIRIDLVPPIANKFEIPGHSSFSTYVYVPPNERIYEWDADPVFIDLTVSKGTVKATIRVVRLPEARLKTMPEEPQDGWGVWQVDPSFFYPVRPLNR